MTHKQLERDTVSIITDAYGSETTWDIKNSTGQTIAGSMNITKLEVDEVDLYTSDFLGNGPYTLKVSKVACYPLSTW